MMGPYEPIAEVTERLEQAGYRRVHQGGHHDVWCDGAQHMHRVGAGYASAEIGVRSEGPSKCDCALWSVDGLLAWPL